MIVSYPSLICQAKKQIISVKIRFTVPQGLPHMLPTKFHKPHQKFHDMRAQKTSAVKRKKKRAIRIAKNAGNVAKNICNRRCKKCKVRCKRSAIMLAQKKHCRFCCKNNAGCIAGMQAMLRVLQGILRRGQIHTLKCTMPHYSPQITRHITAT